jgi:uncharacterized membrane protein YeaQ/YmgE (transglycosylase-associated protein family)
MHTMDGDIAYTIGLSNNSPEVRHTWRQDWNQSRSGEFPSSKGVTAYQQVTAWRHQAITGRVPANRVEATVMSGIIWIIIVGFVAGLIARWLSPGPNTPSGFILTTVLGIGGAFFATFIGQTIGWYRADQGAGFIAATLGAFAVLFIWNRLVASGVIGDPGNRPL